MSQGAENTECISIFTMVHIPPVTHCCNHPTVNELGLSLVFLCMRLFWIFSVVALCSVAFFFDHNTMNLVSYMIVGTHRTKRFMSSNNMQRGFHPQPCKNVSSAAAHWTEPEADRHYYSNDRKFFN